MAVALLVTGYYRSPKLVRAVTLAGPWAEILWTRALDYCAEQKTDGHIPAGMPDVLIGRNAKKHADALVTTGAWLLGNPDGYDIHDYHEWNRTAQELAEREAAKREAKSRAGKAGAAKRWGGRLPKDDEDEEPIRATLEAVVTSWGHDLPEEWAAGQ